MKNCFSVWRNYALRCYSNLLPGLILGMSLLSAPDSIAQCQEDVVCDDVVVGWDHSQWTREMRSVVRIIVDTTNPLDTSCSGVLLNNTLNDNKLYVLTAFHCLDLSPRDGFLSPAERARVADFKYHFHYYNEICNDNNSTKTPIELNENLDAVLVAAWEDTDFALIELNATFDFCAPEMENHLYWAGWTRSATPFDNSPDKVVGLHHPTAGVGGMPMKVSVFNGDPVVHGADPDLWEVPDLWDLGDVDDGSSGSALFNDEHLVTGQLVGGSGYAPCSTGTNPTDYTTYGRFDLSWLGGGTAATQLRPWLCPTCNDQTPDPVSLTGIEYIGGSAVGGIGFDCSDIVFTVRTKSLPACCWEIEAEVLGNACLKGFKVSRNGFQEQIITDYKLINGKLVFEYCISGSDNGQGELRVTPLGTNNSEICSTSTFPVNPDLLCDACDCHNGYSVSYRESGTSGDPNEEGWCCYIPVIEKTSADGCDVYGAFVDGYGDPGTSGLTPLMTNVGDKVELPEVCVPPFDGSQFVKVNLYDILETPSNGDDPMCDISGSMEACCSCPNNYLLEITTINSRPDECCFRVSATWRGSDDSCKPKSVLLFDNHGNYTGNLSSEINGIGFASFSNICINRDDFPQTYQLRFYKEFNVDPNNLPEEMCHLNAEFTPCEFDCCSLFDFTTAEYVTAPDPISGTPSQFCVDLYISQSDSVPGCEFTDLMITDQFNQTWTMPWGPGTTNINLCCLPFPSPLAPLNIWQVVLLNNGHPVINQLTGDTCTQTIIFTCGSTGKTSGNGNGQSVPHVTKSEILHFNSYPNPSNTETFVEFTLNGAADVRLDLRDETGRLVTTLMDKEALPGINTIKLETASLASGSYFIVLKTGNTSRTLPLVVQH